MKISKEKAAENRQALVEAAARLFKEKGIDGVGVAEISKEAGLTHGALYAHFPSKEALAAEAMAYGTKRAYNKLTEKPVTIEQVMDYYLSQKQRDNMSGGCAMAAAASEIARQDENVSKHFTAGYLQMVDYVVGQLGDHYTAEQKRQRGLAIIAAMIGGVAVSRSVMKADLELSDEILSAVRAVMGELSR